MSIIMLSKYYYIQASNVTINFASTTLSNFGTQVPSTASSDNGFDHLMHSTAVPTALLA